MRLPAREWIAAVADVDSFQAWDHDVVSTDPLGFTDAMPYRERLRKGQERSGETEAVVTGCCTVDGVEAVVVAGEFGFLAGTMGVATAERVVRAFERATAQRLPVIALPVSGGTRMQEGTAAFIQMAGCAAAARRHRDAGLLYVVYLRHPTTGGVLGSWASLGHVTWAEPGATLGLTGPRVVAKLAPEPFEPQIQTAEHLAAHGIVDEVVPAEQLGDRLRALLGVVAGGPSQWEPAVPPVSLDEATDVAAWDAVAHSRQADRAGVRELLEACGAQLVEVRGDGAGEDDAGCRVGLGRVCGRSAVVVAQDRVPGQRGAALGAAGYRKARRGMLLAAELGLPLVTLIDTTGAAMTPHDEEGGLAAAIAGCLSELSAVAVPTLSVLVGEGTGGGAVALLPADRVIAAEHAWLSPIAPEGASIILHRTVDRAAEVAAAQAIASTDLRRLGIVDVVVPDGDADAAGRLAAVVGRELAALVAEQPAARLEARRRRYRTVAR
jgi:acyl-CoA carboxylase subunit beta